MAGTLHDALFGDFTLKQVLNASFAENNQNLRDRVSSGIATTEIYAGESDPRGQFTTSDIAGVLANSTISSAGYIVPDTTKTITFQFKERSNQGGYATGSNHYTITSTGGGLVIPTAFQASQGGTATCDLELIMLSTDGLVPYSMNSSASISTAAYNTQYTLGTVAVNGTAINGVDSVQINPGIQAEVQHFDGLNYPQIANIMQINPSATITFRDIASYDAFNAVVTSMTAFTCYFRKRATTGFVADATEEHVKFTFADGLIDSSISGSGNENLQPTITVHGETLVGSATNAIS